MTKDALVITNGEIRYMKDSCLDEVITIPDDVHTIGPHAFRFQRNMRVVIVSESVTHVKERAFEECSGLRLIYLPKSVETIDEDVFKGCELLKICCEDAPRQGWIDGMAMRHFKEYYVTDEDDAFNFHRSSGGFTSHVHEYDKRVYCCYNPDKAEVITNVTREQFDKLVNELIDG